MKKFRVFSLATILLLLFSHDAVFAEEKIETAGYASIDIMSNYIWRGQKLSNSWVLQPSIGINYKGLGFNIWANYDSDRAENNSSETGHGEFSETDFTMNYTFSMEKFNFEGGYTYYALYDENDTQELYLTVGYDTLLSPKLTVYYDFDEGNGAFIIAAISQSFLIKQEVSLEMGASIGYSIKNKVMGYNKDGDEFSNFYNAELSAALNIPVYKAITVTPKIAFTFPLSNDAEEAIKNISDDSDKKIFYGGINLRLDF